MKIIVRYANHENEVREKTLPTMTSRLTRGTWNWQEFVAIATRHKAEDERIVSISEEGY